jgi:hypothetical protein
MEGVDQNYQAPGEQHNYFRVFNGWSKGEGSFSSERTKETDPVTATTTYRANFLKQFDITFQNNFTGVGNAGVMTINTTQYNLPHASFPVLQYSNITASAGSQAYNGIEYGFDHWSDAYPYSYRTILPNDHATYTAFFVGRPLQMWHYGISGNSTIGEPVTIYWNVHLNPYVTEYQIWRKVRHNGVTGSPVLLATLNRYITTYIDWEYIISSGNWDLVSYDVRPYYSVEQTYADPDWRAYFAEGGIIPKQSAGLIPTTFSLENYPNPFNPSTQIKFGLPEAANASLIVYDVLGKKVAELASGYHEAGYYSAVWNATGESHSPLASGIYFARFTATKQSGEVAYTKTTKLLLMK